DDVDNPTSAGGTSRSTDFKVNNPMATLTSILPLSKTAGDAAFALTVNGTNFNSSSKGRLGGADRPTTFVDSTHLTAQLTAADVQVAGTFQITIFNPTPGGGTTLPSLLTVNNPIPTLVSIAPT